MTLREDDPMLKNAELREARGLLAELSGKLTAYAEYVPAIYAALLRQRAEQIDAFLGANAFGTALVGKPEPQSSVRLGPSGDHRLSQDWQDHCGDPACDMCPPFSGIRGHL